MTYDFDRLIDRRRTDSSKWQTYGPDVLPLWVADMDFQSPEPVIRALRERVEHGVFGYLMLEQPEFHQLFADRLLKRYGWRVSPDAVVIIPGVIPGFNVAGRVLAASGDGLILQTPVYPPILRAAGNIGPARAPAGRELRGRRRRVRGGDPRPDALLPALQPAQPRRPGLPPRRAPAAGGGLPAPQPHDRRRRDPLRADLPGPPPYPARVDLVSTVNVLGYTAAYAAYRDGQPWLEELLRYLEANRDFAIDYARTRLPGVRVAAPEATYLAWLDCRNAGAAGANPFTFFLDKARVALSDGVLFGHGGEGFVRLNFGCPRAMLTEALERMREALMRDRPA